MAKSRSSAHSNTRGVDGRAASTLERPSNSRGSKRGRVGGTGDGSGEGGYQRCDKSTVSNHTEYIPVDEEEIECKELRGCGKEQGGREREAGEKDVKGDGSGEEGTESGEVRPGRLKGMDTKRRRGARDRSPCAGGKEEEEEGGPSSPLKEQMVDAEDEAKFESRTWLLSHVAALPHHIVGLFPSSNACMPYSLLVCLSFTRSRGFVHVREEPEACM